ncbi:methyltransferase domain-containing protein [Azorhizobium sp. AG788]|uniref:class I SAM-dependent methyltransferase n=1 Tax=Azorhizobium sp. AG788 TaxID=2183897 RepID=UPI0031388C6E
MRSIPFSELDELLVYFDEGYKTSHDEAYRRFSEVQLLPPEDLPADPFSDEYSKVFMDLYKKISHQTNYSVQNERAEFDVEYHTLRPYPYFTKSLKRTAQHYDLMAKLFDMMDLEPGSSILECGFGWGNTTLALAMVGYNVTALDIEEKYCKLVQNRADILKLSNVKFVHSDFLWVETTDEKFDAVVYFESFHHCWEFDRLLKALHRVINPGGKIYFGAEPINEQFTVPWGVRLDGESLFVARRSGWMELGFHSTFFQELLRRNGWRGQCVSPHFWVAVRRNEPIVILADDPRLQTQIGVRAGNTLKLSAPATEGGRYFGLFGPYINLANGIYNIDIAMTIPDHVSGTVTFDVCCESGQNIIYCSDFDIETLRSGHLEVQVTAPECVSSVEFRLNVPAGFEAEIEKITITEVY